jgi:cell fate regulator YaaT (PSP1 superfamily)
LKHEVVNNVEEIEVFKLRFPERGVFTFDANDMDLHVGDYCIAEDGNNGVSLGQVVGKLKLPVCGSRGDLKKILRKATEEDKKRCEDSARKEKEAREICRKKINDRELPMKLVSARYSPNGSKITFYFTSERRVDFRELVKDLAYIFKRRIELRQIGVRDETRMRGGFGCCGRQLCCATFLKKLGRMKIEMAKEQDMTLTPSKISGVCGRLMCCLRYEKEWYQEIKENMPRVGSTVRAKGISGKVEGIDSFHSVVRVRSDDGQLVEVMLEDLEGY